jgi:Zn-dependent peptidase ImmA (M78 family)
LPRERTTKAVAAVKSKLMDSPQVLTEEAVQDQVSDIIDTYVRKVGTIVTPVSEKKLCEVVEELKGVRIKCQAVRKPSTYEEGLLTPVRGGFVIKYQILNRSGKPFARTKIRETICHELGHILFYDCNSSVPRLLMMPPEHVCHEIARQFLLPKTVLQKRFLEAIKPNLNLIRLLRQLSSEFEVATWIMAQRLTEDLSLIKDTMITFWRYRNESDGLTIFIEPDRQISFEDFYRDSRLCSELKEFVPKYWRYRIHAEAWDKAVSKVILHGYTIYQPSLVVKSKRRQLGKTKEFVFDVECEPWSDMSSQSSFQWKDQKRLLYNAISVERFYSCT